MSLLPEQVEKYKNFSAVLVNNTAKNTVINANHLMEPSEILELIKQGDINLQNCLTIGQVIGSTLTVAREANTPITANIVENYTEENGREYIDIEALYAFVNNFNFLRNSPDNIILNLNSLILPCSISYNDANSYQVTININIPFGYTINTDDIPTLSRALLYYTNNNFVSIENIIMDPSVVNSTYVTYILDIITTEDITEGLEQTIMGTIQIVDDCELTLIKNNELFE